MAQGGLGIKNPHQFNIALLTKLASRLILEKDQLWAKILKAKYFPNSHPLEASKVSKLSWIWTSIRKGLDLIKGNFVWQVKNGNSVKIWEDKWIPNSEVIPQPQDSQATVPKRVQELITEENKWDQEKLDSYFSPKAILRIKLFVWKLAGKALPTSSRLGAHNPEIEPNCQLCNSQVQETENHLFGSCPFAKAIWFSFSLGNLTSSANTDPITSWVKGWLVYPDLDNLVGKISTILWFIWKYRCSVVFENIIPNPMQLIDQINRFLQSIPQKDKTKGLDTNHLMMINTRWSDINTDWIVYIYASFKEEDLSMGYAHIVYSVDHHTFMHISAGSETTTSAFHAEAKSLQKAVIWLRDNVLSSVSIVTDCKVLADSINKDNTNLSWTVENIVKEAKTILRDLPQAQVKFTNRKYNSAADLISKEARIKILQHMSTKFKQKIKHSSIISNVFDRNEIVNLLYYIC
ncbi:uncharacterized protein LOC113295487 [Papaver somniferum]|uniref:uncharacterized protein LOC113295487 n=1 Tax=Papaver somniferum TaxID=3469 RepID=UPI000E6FF470|nr:uncharacterized protein LOC113295487 [Papaver somniferum]